MDKIFPKMCDAASPTDKIIIEAKAIFNGKKYKTIIEPIMKRIGPLPGKLFLNSFLSKLSITQEARGILVNAQNFDKMKPKTRIASM